MPLKIFLKMVIEQHCKYRRENYESVSKPLGSLPLPRPFPSVPVPSSHLCTYADFLLDVISIFHIAA